MHDLTVLTTFMGWCLALNLTLLVLSSMMLSWERDWIKRLHKRLFGVSESDLDLIYFKYLAYYKLLVIVFNLVPYIALRIMS